ncbi:MAG: hypothetical protein QG656_1019 [Candidatus Hydrogenedentes bacterium]|nr:hypothetical protein [Candidatus Hydrogenedentota bacterium]
MSTTRDIDDATEQRSLYDSTNRTLAALASGLSSLLGTPLDVIGDEVCFVANDIRIRILAAGRSIRLQARIADTLPERETDARRVAHAFLPYADHGRCVLTLGPTGSVDLIADVPVDATFEDEFTVFLDIALACHDVCRY